MQGGLGLCAEGEVEESGDEPAGKDEVHCGVAVFDDEVEGRQNGKEE